MARKHLSNVPRYASGRVRPKPLGPTAQLIAKRVAKLAIAGVDPAKSNRPLANTGLAGAEQNEYFRLGATWLGCLYAAGIIDQPQFKAGNRYAENYRLMFKQGFPGSALDGDMPRISKDAQSDSVPFQPYATHDEPDGLGLAWKATENVLKALCEADGSKRLAHLVKDVCVFDRFEMFIDTSTRRPTEAWIAAAKDRTRFVSALDALAIAYGYKGEPRKIVTHG